MPTWPRTRLKFPILLLDICDPLWRVGWPTHHYQLLSLLYNYNTDWNSSQLSCWRLLEFPQWNFVDPFSIDEPHTFDIVLAAADFNSEGRRTRATGASAPAGLRPWLTSLIEFQILPLSKIFDNIRRSKKQFIFFDCLMWCKYPLNQKDLILSKIILVSN